MRGLSSTLRLPLAANLFRHHTGRLPSSLQELDSFVGQPTVDVDATIYPIAIRSTDDLVVIYHCGRDFIDNGGDIDRENPKDWGIRIEK